MSSSTNQFGPPANEPPTTAERERADEFDVDRAIKRAERAMSDKPDPEIVPEHLHEQAKDNADNVSPHVHQFYWPRERRERAAELLGPNWACILNGLGDQ